MISLTDFEIRMTNICVEKNRFKEFIFLLSFFPLQITVVIFALFSTFINIYGSTNPRRVYHFILSSIEWYRTEQFKSEANMINISRPGHESNLCKI